VIDRPGAPGCDVSVEMRADPRHFALADARDAHRHHQVIDPTSGEAFEEPASRPHGARRRSGTPARATHGKNYPVRTFGIFTGRSPPAVVSCLSRVPIRWVVRNLGALVEHGAGEGTHLGIDDGLRPAAE
jgi:hypothetical protein